MRQSLALLLTPLLLTACLSCTRGVTDTPPASPDSTGGATSSDSLAFTSPIRSILQDSKGSYWIGSDEEGVCRFDGKSYTYYTTEDGLNSNQVISIQEDEQGTLWLGTGKGVCSWTGKGFLQVQVPSTLMPFAPWELTPHDLWFAGDWTHLIRISGGKVYRHARPPLTGGKSAGHSWGATGFSRGPSGILWIAHYDGVLGFDGTSWTQINDSTEHLQGGEEYMHVRSILEDSRQRLWIGNNGIGLMLREGGSITHFSKERGLMKGKVFQAQSPPGTLMHVFAIHEDRQGNIWFGDRDTGCWRYDGKEMRHFVIDESLPSPHIWQIYEDRQGRLLFCTTGGVYAFDGTAFARAM